MRLTNGQFVEQLLSSGVKSNELVHYLETSMKLLKKYGRLILTQRYLNEVKKTSPEIADILSSLKIADKSTVAKIKTIVRLLKEKSTDYHEEFVVSLGNESQHNLVKKFLDEKFENSEIEQKKGVENSAKISGEGRFYKRSLDQDAKKLLGIN